MQFAKIEHGMRKRAGRNDSSKNDMEKKQQFKSERILMALQTKVTPKNWTLQSHSRW